MNGKDHIGVGGVAGPLPPLPMQWNHLGRYNPMPQYTRMGFPHNPGSGRFPQDLLLRQIAANAQYRSPADRPELVPRPPSTPKTEEVVYAGGVTVDPVHRIHRLERNLKFLKEQHALVLSSLHQEVDSLKIKNKELQFQLVTGEKLLEQNDSQNQDISEDTASQKQQHLEHEVKVLRIALQNSRDRNMYLSFLVDQLKCQQQGNTQGIPEKSVQQRIEPVDNARCAHTPHILAPADLPPLYIRRLQEYEDTIFRLRLENDDQKQEIHNLKGELQKVFSSGPWISNKLQPRSACSCEDACRLPRISLRHKPKGRRGLDLPLVTPPPPGSSSPLPGYPRSQTSLSATLPVRRSRPTTPHKPTQ